MDYFKKSNEQLSREGFSDRTAYLMAKISELAYIRFEDWESDRVKDAVKKILNAQNEDKAIEAFKENLTDIHSLRDEAKRDKLKTDLTEMGFTYHEEFTNEETGTQAILAWSHENEQVAHLGMKIAVLAFRGSEPNRKDWFRNFSIGDLRLQDGKNIFQVHQGFFDGFKSVQKNIEDKLSNLVNGDQGYRLYVTGHSLGGALAIIATHQLARKKVDWDPDHGTKDRYRIHSNIEDNRIRACYTFGSPRVAGKGFEQSIKSPIYRIVNANDIVPRVPPVILPMILQPVIKLIGKIMGTGWMLSILAWLINLLSRSKDINITKDVLKISRVFMHHGDMRYIQAKSDNEGRIVLLSNPSIIIRFREMCIRKNAKSLYEDHDLGIYINKLLKYAKQRNA